MQKRKTILVTGGAGFVGSATLRYLFEKYPENRYIVLDALTYAGDLHNIPASIQQAPNFTFVRGDVRDEALVEGQVAQAEAVLHFAAETHVARSISDNANFFETDVLGTKQVANAVWRHRDTVDRFIHISTSEVYGTAETPLIDERHPLNPLSPYAAAKTGADRLVYAYRACYNIPAVIVRPFNIYGPHQHPEKAIPRFITSRVLGEQLTLHGTGEHERDYVYVDNVVQALDLVLHAPQEKVLGEVFNVGSGTGRTIRSIAEAVVKLTAHAAGPANVSAILATRDRPGQVGRHAADFKKITSALGWKPTTDFEEGLKKTVAWYEKNRIWWEGKLHMRHVPIEVERGRTELQ